MKPINFVLSQFPSLFKHGANDGVLISQDNFLFSFCFVFVPPKHEKLKRYQTSTSISCGGREKHLAQLSRESHHSREHGSEISDFNIHLFKFVSIRVGER